MIRFADRPVTLKMKPTHGHDWIFRNAIAPKAWPRTAADAGRNRRPKGVSFVAGRDARGCPHHVEGPQDSRSHSPFRDEAREPRTESRTVSQAVETRRF